MKHCIAIVLLVCSFSLSAQYRQLSSQAEISVITVGPGGHFNDCFGHSAFRIHDPIGNIDIAYNYGVFDTSEPGFYTRFAMGTQDYFLAGYEFKRFLGNYQAQNRWVKEQVLNLARDEVQHVFEFLENNRKKENRAYRYDPYFNNCATKMRDLVVDALGDKITFDHSHLPEGMSMRDLTDENSFNHPWWDFGVDIALGTVIDGPATPEEFMFLPDYVFAAYEHASINRNGQQIPAVKVSRSLFDSDFYEVRKESIMPWMVFAIMAVIVILVTYIDYTKNRRSRWLDFVLMLITGLCGLMIILLWFATSHKITPNNLNILWAFLPNLVVGFVLLKKNPPAWVRSYVRFLVILLLGALFIWVLRIQVYSTALFPIMAFLAVRYVFLWRKALAPAKS